MSFQPIVFVELASPHGGPPVYVHRDHVVSLQESSTPGVTQTFLTLTRGVAVVASAPLEIIEKLETLPDEGRP